MSSSGAYLEGLQRRAVISWLFVFVLGTAFLLWHGPSFPLTVLTLCAGLVTVAKAVGLYRLRRDRKVAYRSSI